MAPIPNRTQAELQADAAAAGYGATREAPKGWAGTSRTHGRIELVNQGRVDTMQVDSTQAPGYYTADVDIHETVQMRKAALMLAGHDEPTATAMATAGAPAVSLVDQVHAAADTLRQQLDREVATCEAMIEHGEAFDVRDGRNRLADLRQVRQTLDALAATVEYNSPTLTQKLAAVEALRVRMVAAAKDV